jgi:putative DeoR family transcriptional regulator (stage III sporulation protein D)
MRRDEYLYFLHCKIEDRILSEAQWIIDNPRTSIRQLAGEFCMSKSQVHRDLHELRFIDDDLYIQVKIILRSHNKSRF